MEEICKTLQSFSKISWTKTTLILCLIPFVLSLLVLIILFLLANEFPGAVVSNSRICAGIGKDVMEDGGSAADAAIATMLCEGIALPNSAGIGGGFVALLYMGGHFDSIIAAPTVPEAFGNIDKLDKSYTEGAKSIGVPGELMGYWEMHLRYGILPWKRLLQPSIDLCENGIPMTQWFAGLLRYYSSKISKVPSLRKVFPYWKRGMYSEDFKLKFPILAKTLRKIANEGVSIFYNGYLGQAFIEDIAKEGGILTLEDLKKYRVVWNDDLPSLRLGQKLKFVTTGLPTSGPLVALILNVIKGFENEAKTPLFWHIFLEASKHAFGLSQSLGDVVNDPEFQNVVKETYLSMLDPDFAVQIRNSIKFNETFDDPEFYGTKYPIHSEKGSSNICILAPSGDAVGATTSLLFQFGAFFQSSQTGIIPNNLLNRFLNTRGSMLESSPLNRPIPGKTFLIPHCPAIVLISSLSKVFYIVSASGGLKAITLIATSIIRYVLMDKNAAGSVDLNFLHHQLIPNWIEYDEYGDHDLLEYLSRLGHKIVQKHTHFENFSAVTCIGHRSKYPDMYYDLRVGGSKELVTPRHELNLVLVIIVGFLTVIIIGIMLYEVLNPRRSSMFRGSSA